MRLTMSANKSLLNWILIAKGIGIVLVVIGHFCPDNEPDYWGYIRNIIYSFHMPLFFLLSGFLYSHAKHKYADLIKGKVKRLLYPFVSIAILFFVIKYIAGLAFQLEHSIGFESIIALLLTPSRSYMPLLWFVHALFLIFLIYPIIRTVINNNPIILLFFVLVNLLLGSDYIILGKVVANIPFFILGIILRETTELKKIAIAGKPMTIIASFIIFSLTYLLSLKLNTEHQAMYLFELVLGVIGTLFIINLSSFIDNSGRKNIKAVLTQIGFYSMTIYLFHTLFESAVRIGFQQVLGRFDISFEVMALTAIIAGVVFPLFLEMKILRQYIFTRKYILGSSSLNP